MRLTKLELQGFKSFADQTALLFEDGVTAIVGPNGCGKSNVSDAVRWVLGEQRARALRGAKMEEVIFQGSSARRAVNIAEVSLHLSNDEGVLPVPFREVVITRRLSRSGESDYLLNGTLCRLRDIQDLVRGTGLGAESGVVIEARMIDALLSDRPDERRELFEEAAGVSLYRDRRRSTERRLEETALDLARLDDLIAEVQSQVRSLARQRRKAERHGELMTRRFSVELTLAAREMEAWHDELARLEARVANLRHSLPEGEERVRDAERRRDDSHGARTAAEARRSELSRLVNGQQQDVLRLEGEIRVAEERQRNAGARRERAEEERRAGEALESQLAADRRTTAAEREQMERELAAAREELGRREAGEEAARAAVTAARTAYESAERELRAHREQLRHLELDREAVERELREIGDRAGELGVERETLAEALERSRSGHALSLRAVEESGAISRDATAALERARIEADAARSTELHARAEMFRADEAVAALQGKVNALEQLERERVGLAPAAAKLLRERDRFGPGAVLGPLSDFVTTAAESAALIERFLGATVHAVLVRDGAVADAIREWHAAASPGPLLLLPLDAPANGLPESASLAGAVEAVEPARGWVNALLGHVRPLDGGDAFVDSRGAVWLPGSLSGPGPLRRRAELSALRTELEAAAAAREAASVAFDTARANLEAAEATVNAASETAARAQAAVRAAAEERDELARRCGRLERDLASVDQQVERLGERRAELDHRSIAIDDERRALERRVADEELLLMERREELAAAERAQDAAREERTRWQVEQAQVMARLQMVADREHRLEREAATAAQRLHSLLSELGDIAKADGQLARKMAEWQMELDSRRATLADGEARLAEAERAVRAADAGLESAERALDEQHRRAAGLSEELHHAELRLSELGGRRTAIRERLEAEWRRPLEEMLDTLVPLDLEEEVLRADLSELRQELDAIGPVNPLAIEEHEEEGRRLDFLTGQRADLMSARSSLQQAIREIDSTARELFLATFVQVRENFRQIFMTLFGGGECDLRLENPEMPLDCDIEIHASPRGKRTQRIHLLSSGERALVALSLLFGIFLTKPSPFCLLDEVDAPLDDQNIGRFVRMLNQFKQKTQFIVITHNPRTTTEAADVVYGVTMQEPGVSSFVSVRMRGGAAVTAGALSESPLEAAAAPV